MQDPRRVAGARTSSSTSTSRSATSTPASPRPTSSATTGSFFEGTTHAPIEPHCASRVVRRPTAAHALVRDAGPALPAPRAREGARAAALAHPRDRAAERRRVRRQVRPVRPRVRGRAARDAHAAAGEDLLDREEVFYAHRGRHPMKMRIRDRREEGRRDHRASTSRALDGGAYGSFGLVTTYYTGALLTVPYRDPGVQVRRRARVHEQAALRAEARARHVQPRFAFECQLDKIAESSASTRSSSGGAILQPANSRTVNDLRITSTGLGECLEAVRSARRGWNAKRGKLPYGQGHRRRRLRVHLRHGCRSTGTRCRSRAREIRIDRGGGVTVFCGTAEIGQGSDTMLASVVAEELGLAARGRARRRGRHRPRAGRPRRLLEPRHVHGRQRGERRRREAARAARRRPRRRSSACRSSGSSTAYRRVYDLRDPDEASSRSSRRPSSPRRSSARSARPARYKTPNGIGGNYRGAGVGPSPAYSFQARVAEVTVDLETGTSRSRRSGPRTTAAARSTRRTSRARSRARPTWASARSSSRSRSSAAACTRSRRCSTTRCRRRSTRPSSTRSSSSRSTAKGPFGAKEAGEGPLHPVIPAIANAIYDAIGVRFDETPITAEKILDALGKRDNRGVTKDRIGPDGLGDGKVDPKRAIAASRRRPTRASARRPGHRRTRCCVCRASAGRAHVVDRGRDAAARARRGGVRLARGTPSVPVDARRGRHRPVPQHEAPAVHAGSSSSRSAASKARASISNGSGLRHRRRRDAHRGRDASDRAREVHARSRRRPAAVSTPQLRNMGTIGGNLCLDTRCNWYDQSLFWRTRRGLLHEDASRGRVPRRAVEPALSRGRERGHGAGADRARREGHASRTRADAATSTSRSSTARTASATWPSAVTTSSSQ